jgi:hypothetical protein
MLRVLNTRRNAESMATDKGHGDVKGLYLPLIIGLATTIALR